MTIEVRNLQPTLFTLYLDGSIKVRCKIL